ncbi:Chitinase, GH18 family [Daejeonella rubra]|uniref:chitinase n=1 Tax=Daejeonella rubra TaxID=990371 RepID=A0A1G9PZ56_9SPHI|nr:glycosyl hydrolase family 18 protein [Daejeonella rubra]SDM03771.1 Chitinase, GH18 family [Daejeonella rubra]
MKKYILFILVISLGLNACKKNGGSAPTPAPITPKSTYVSDRSYKIVAYFPSYRNPDSIDASKYKMITHLYYAFLNPDESGNLKTLAEPARFSKVISIAKSNGVKVGISVSGPDATFVSLAANASSRTNLVKNVLAFVKQYNLDGVDMDWEYPRTSNGSDLTYNSLIKELSDTLHNNSKYLSAAVTAGVYAGAVRDGVRSDTYNYIDFFNIMSYDGMGWDKSDLKQHSSYNMAVSSLDTWLVLKGLPKEKAVLGIASYGRNSLNVAAGYREFINAGANSEIDSAMYKGAMYYYNGTGTIRNKTLLSKERANGIMLWEFYFDTNGKTSLLKSVNDALGRVYN